MPATATKSRMITCIIQPATPKDSSLLAVHMLCTHCSSATTGSNTTSTYWGSLIQPALINCWALTAIDMGAQAVPVHASLSSEPSVCTNLLLEAVGDPQVHRRAWQDLMVESKLPHGAVSVLARQPGQVTAAGPFGYDSIAACGSSR